MELGEAFELTGEDMEQVLHRYDAQQETPKPTRGPLSVKSQLRNVFQSLYGSSHLSQQKPLSRFWTTAFGGERETSRIFELPLELHQVFGSACDASLKMIFRVKSGSGQHLIESVLIPEKGRLTLCVSSQVGCAQACRFCQTGRMGLRHQLRTAEIVAQVVLANRVWTEKCEELTQPLQGFGAPRVTNVVFMGMGEPLDNTDAVLRACEVMSEPLGLGIGVRKITVSTVGILPGVKQLLNTSKVNLALSLHTPFEEERSRIMPVNQRHPLKDVLTLLRQERRSKDEFFIQYTLINGVNDSEQHAEALVRVLQGLPCKVNLIPLNEHSGAAFRRPALESVSRFQKRLKNRGLVATVRLSKGRDIEAACGQLVHMSQ